MTEKSMQWSSVDLIVSLSLELQCTYKGTRKFMKNGNSLVSWGEHPAWPTLRCQLTCQLRCSPPVSECRVQNPNFTLHSSLLQMYPSPLASNGSTLAESLPTRWEMETGFHLSPAPDLTTAVFGGWTSKWELYLNVCCLSSCLYISINKLIKS